MKQKRKLKNQIVSHPTNEELGPYMALEQELDDEESKNMKLRIEKQRWKLNFSL